MATSEIEQFLRVEEEANRLLDVLEQLRKETVSYRASRELLDAAAKAVDELASNIADTTKQLVNLRETLQSISTSEMLRVQETVIDRLAELRTDLDNVQRSITETLDQSVTSAFERTARQIDLLRETFEAAEREQKAEILRTQGIITGETSELQAEINVHRSLTETIGQATTGVLKRTVTQVGALQERIELAEQERRETFQHLHRQLELYRESSHQEIEAVKQAFTAQLTDIKAALVTVRNLALFLLALFVITTGLFVLLVILAARG
ncbi:MAG: hypothetical protein DDG58_06295 [Ardenticatenia bacterium]|nr:MAG: hypothetical protein DDG58_06295 [Ardenticatenia bacterium]